MTDSRHFSRKFRVVVGLVNPRLICTIGSFECRQESPEETPSGLSASTLDDYII